MGKVGVQSESGYSSPFRGLLSIALTLTTPFTGATSARGGGLEQEKNEQKIKEEFYSWKETVKQLKKGAEKGDKPSQEQLAKCYSQGCGCVEKNKEEAYFWWSLDAENTKGVAAYERDYAESQLSPEQISGVKKRLGEWKATHTQPPAPAKASNKQ